jgi:guanylate kinase
MNKIIILTAPSGGGKTSIMRHLMVRFPNHLAFSISAATRKPRGAEKDGVDYYFITAETFKQKIEEQAFVEWEMVYEGKYYGTLKSELHRIWADNKVPILDIDVQGAIHIQEQFPGQVLSLFIQPPSVEELRRRLEARGTETPESLEARISKASYELSFSHAFSRIIVNDKLETACEEAEMAVRQFISSQGA